MILLTNERIPAAATPGRQGEPFQPGDVLLVRYMTIPTVVTVLARGDDSVITWTATESIEQFNQRVIAQLGRRRRFLGFWMPWVTLNPKRVIHCDLDDNLGTDESFWRGRGKASVR